MLSCQKGCKCSYMYRHLMIWKTQQIVDLLFFYTMFHGRWPPIFRQDRWNVVDHKRQKFWTKRKCLQHITAKESAYVYIFVYCWFGGRVSRVLPVFRLLWCQFSCHVGFFAQNWPNLVWNRHFLLFWARPCRLIWCSVGGLVGGCGARAVSRKTPIYFKNR